MSSGDSRSEQNPPHPLIGWDVGGAHLKAALLVDGHLRAVRQTPCPLWRGLEHLSRALELTLADWPLAPCHAVTMTGEMVDLFTDRASGVAALSQLLQQRLGQVLLFAGRRGFVAVDQAAIAAPEIASANWLASAAWAAARLDAAVLIDIGSTTSDIIPLAGGQPATSSRSDLDRLGNGELVYTGVVRTPVHALAARVPLRGRWQTLCAEFFASAADVYRLLGVLPADADQHDTADGRGKSVAESTARLARMLGCDASAASAAEWHQLAAYLARCQLTQLQDGLALVLSAHPLAAPAPLLGAGVGRFLVDRLSRYEHRPYRDFGTLCSDEPALQAAAADCAPAVAVGLLAARLRV